MGQGKCGGNCLGTFFILKPVFVSAFTIYKKPVQKGSKSNDAWSKPGTAQVPANGKLLGFLQSFKSYLANYIMLVGICSKGHIIKDIYFETITVFCSLLFCYSIHHCCLRHSWNLSSYSGNPFWTKIGHLWLYMSIKIYVNCFTWAMGSYDWQIELPQFT